MFESSLSSTGLILIASAAATAVLHTVVPDHWLPFVLVGRSQSWTTLRTLLFAGISALLHVFISIGLGLLGYFIGLASVEAVGGNLRLVVGFSLALFGLLYFVWAVRSHGGVLHIGHSHGAHGLEHSLEGKKRSISGWGLSVLMGFNPCILALPVIGATAAEGAMITILASLSFGIATFATLLILTAVGIVTASRFELKFLSDHGEKVSGALIFLAGLAYLVID